jgi:tRNA-specific 2-thiouridylase
VDGDHAFGNPSDDLPRLAAHRNLAKCALSRYITAMNAPAAFADAAVEAARAAVGLPVGTRVVAAMSGGVDSTVTAALLARAGYDVVGVTLQLYDHGAAIQKKGACCAGQDIHDARQAADAIGIPHYVLDYESRFREQVIEDFADAYLRGETPIPCIRCNQTVKFRDLLDVARDLGAAAMATGHYVRREIGPTGPQLRRAADPARDQSYFLFATTADQLDYLRFPLGGLPKPEVRRAAAELGLAIADKPDSQDICFVPEGRYTTVIDRLRPHGAEPGDIVHLDGRVLGRHEGVTRYTVGQRRGLNVAVGDPLFVVKIDVDGRRVIVGPREALLTTGLVLKETNWLGDEASMVAAAEAGRPVLARVRSTAEPVPARLSRTGDAVGVTFDAAEHGVSPGQACVLYASEAPDRVLGGGFIDRTVGAL